jgi:hypothetical protein
MAPQQWPKSELSVSSDDIRCDRTDVKPSETVRCRATIHNRGPVEAVARIYVGQHTVGSDIGGGPPIPNHTVAPYSQVVVEWLMKLPEADAVIVSVRLELHTRHAYGGQSRSTRLRRPDIRRSGKRQLTRERAGHVKGAQRRSEPFTRPSAPAE